MSELELLKFIPFRLNRLAAEVSTKLADVYSERFDIDIVEWRILITLAAEQTCSAQHIVHSTRTHKSRISRGVTRMMDVQLITRTESEDDRRQTQLRLTRKGRALYKKIAPVVLEQERKILECFDSEDLRAFTLALDKLERSLDLVHHLDK